MIQRSILIFVTLIVLLAGCSQNEPEKENVKVQKQSKTVESEPETEIENEPHSEVESQMESEKSEPQTLLTDEEMLMKPAGPFAGSNYDKQKVQAKLDQLPDNLTADQYTEELLLLLGEDYSSYITTFKNFDTEVKVDNQRPNGNVTLPASRKLNISILLDASGSMEAQINGKSKMDSAKEAIQTFTDKLPENAEVSLRVYGHKGTGNEKDKQLSCSSTEEIFHGPSNQTKQISKALASVKPAGWTPIANALESVKKDMNPETTDSVVYVVSDGIETCGGDPAKVAKELNQAKVKTVVNIIGFAVDNEGQKLLRQVAASGGGEFTSVDNGEALKDYLNKAYDKLRGEWTIWKEKGEGDANIQKEKKQGIINNTTIDMQILANKEYEKLLAALRFLENKYGNTIPHGEIWNQVTERKNFVWNYARDTGDRLYRAATKSGNEVYDEIKEEGDKNIDDLTNKKKD
ncbi:VWA domain-containing protein [Bacillus norwichensis]|uniref:VWA domain-containing protein n=1 Tax=Bacillus norwichensis TaxID=2762217 RepID=A0ABR8VJT9_9BACI|nr:VWA domain-containing protein [Bacillus norwichensis]MBD8005041.1 VWA domain-containing protein [Bacillus norwichensis]